MQLYKWRNFVSFFSSLRFVGFHLCTALIHCFSLICCCAWGQFQTSFSCETDIYTFDYGQLWYTEEFMVKSITARCPGPLSPKQAQRPLHQLIWGVWFCALYQISPLWSHLSIRHCSSLVVSSDALFREKRLSLAFRVLDGALGFM